MPVASCQLMPLPDEGFSCCRCCCSWKRVLFRERHLLADIWTVHRRHIWTLSGHFTSCQNPLPLPLYPSLCLMSLNCAFEFQSRSHTSLFLTLNDWWSCCIVCGCFQVWANFTTTITTIETTTTTRTTTAECARGASSGNLYGRLSISHQKYWTILFVWLALIGRIFCWYSGILISSCFCICVLNATPSSQQQQQQQQTEIPSTMRRQLWWVMIGKPSRVGTESGRLRFKSQAVQKIKIEIKKERRGEDRERERRVAMGRTEDSHPSGTLHLRRSVITFNTWYNFAALSAGSSCLLACMIDEPLCPPQPLCYLLKLVQQTVNDL